MFFSSKTTFFELFSSIFLNIKNNISHKYSDKVNDKNQHGSIDNCCIRSFTHSDGSFRTIIAFKTTDQTDGKTKEKCFNGSRNNISEGNRFENFIKIYSIRNV